MASPPPQSPPETRQRVVKTKTEVPDEVAEIVARSLQIGVGTGACGLLFGATAGIVRGTTPVLFSLVSGLQWFGLGSVYYGTRSMVMARHGPGHQATPYQKIEASALGGAVSGATVAALTRGPKNVLPGGLVFSLLGAGGQFVANRWATYKEASQGREDGGWLNSKWSPARKLTDQEYADVLEEKLLRLDAEIAIVDEHISGLKAQKEDLMRGATKPSPTTTTPREGKS